MSSEPSEDVMDIKSNGVENSVYLDDTNKQTTSSTGNGLKLDDVPLQEVISNSDPQRSEVREDDQQRMSERELEDTLERIRKRFSQFAHTNGQISESEFKKALGSKAKSFFADRFFWYLDTDHNGYIDMSELTNGARILLAGTTAEKVNFVYTLYDTDNSGKIEREEMKQVLKSCVKENRMKLSIDEIETLTEALYEFADSNRDGVLTREDFTKLLQKYPGALDNLAFNASNWLQPSTTTNKSKAGCGKYFTKRYLTNNAKYLTFIAMFWVVSAALFCTNAYIYRKENGWVIFARGCGMCLNFTSALVVLLPLRNTITYLRSTFLWRVLPLDYNIGIHMFVGIIIFVWSCLHTAGHIGNAVYLSNRSNLTVVDILFTTKAGFGWVAHSATITGDILLLILILMVVASRPCVRRAGHFEVFYWTHKFYYAYFILLVIHAENFLKWVILPATIFIVEKVITYFIQRRDTTVTAVSLLPSEVTHLSIAKPSGFDYKPGDYVHLKIPAIASHEWHPFTISSPPEQDGTFSVHIRSAGNWTKGLREYLETSQSDETTVSDNSQRRLSRRRWGTSLWEKPRTSIARKKINSIKARSVVKKTDLKVCVDGPYGSPCRTIFDAEHAILVGSGIGATPFSSILQSIVHRFKAGRVTCPNCGNSWCQEPIGLMKLKKVDFVWINRDQTNFEWFTALLSRLEQEMARESSLKDSITMHMYMTGAPSQYEITGVGVQMALDLVRDAKDTCLITGLTTRTQGGRPDFNKLIADIKSKSPCSKLKVFFCGNPALAKTIKESCMKHGVGFSKEQF